MTFAKFIIFLFALTCQAQFLPIIGHTAGATNVTLVKMLPEVYLTNGLFAVWHCDDTNSSRLTDSWGTNHLYFRSQTNLWLTNGVLGNAVYVNTANGAGEFTNDAAGMTFKTFTVSWWSYADSNLGGLFFYCGSNSTARFYNQSCCWGVYAGAAFSTRFVTDNTRYSFTGFTTDPTKWEHNVVVYSNAVGRAWAYKNGVHVNNIAATAFAGDILPTSFSIYGSADLGFKDEFAIWSRGLTASEIDLLFKVTNWRDYPKQYR